MCCFNRYTDDNKETLLKATLKFENDHRLEGTFLAAHLDKFLIFLFKLLLNQIFTLLYFYFTSANITPLPYEFIKSGVKLITISMFTCPILKKHLLYRYLKYMCRLYGHIFIYSIFSVQFIFHWNEKFYQNQLMNEITRLHFFFNRLTNLHLKTHASYKPTSSCNFLLFLQHVLTKNIFKSIEWSSAYILRYIDIFFARFCIKILFLFLPYRPIVYTLGPKHFLMQKSFFC